LEVKMVQGMKEKFTLSDFSLEAKKFSKEITAIDGERSQEKVTADIIGKFETLNPKS